MSEIDLDLSPEYQKVSGRSPEQSAAIKAFIQRFAKKDVNPKTLEDYDVAAVRLPRGTQGARPNRIYIETPMGLKLEYKGKPIAVVMYEPLEGSILRVKQLQGAGGSIDALQPLKWERLLLASLIEHAKHIGAAEVRVPASWTLPFFHQALGLRQDRSKEEHQATMKLHYDVTPKRMGFTWNEEEKCWTYKLPNIPNLPDKP